MDCCPKHFGRKYISGLATLHNNHLHTQVTHCYWITLWWIGHEFPDLPKFAMQKFGVTLNEQHCSITHRTIRSHRTTMMLFLITECSHFSSSIAICTTDFSTRSTCCRHSFPIQCTHVYKSYIDMYNCTDNFPSTYIRIYLNTHYSKRYNQMVLACFVRYNYTHTYSYSPSVI